MRRLLSDKEATSLGLKLNKKQKGKNKARYNLKDEQWSFILDVRSRSNTKTNGYGTKFVLSAWNDKGYMMDINEYCQVYKLPRKDITSYKLVSHTGIPFYNIVFRENKVVNDIDYTFVDEIIKNHIKPIELKPIIVKNTKTFDRLIYSDVHIGMTPNKNGYSLYGGKWDKQEQLKVMNKMVDEVLKNKTGNVLYIDELGDFLDGWNGETVRKGHSLPQNMDNQAMFDAGLEFKVKMIDRLANYYEKIISNNIVEDNHAGSFGYIVNSAFKNIVELKYSNVEVNLLRKFINHYFVGKHCFVLSHGKDSHALKFGFKPFLDKKQESHIDQYCKDNEIYRNAKYIEFSKGDSHQMLFDYATSNDFDYCNYPSVAPPSEWVQTNYGKSRQAFVIQNIPFKNGKKSVKQITI